ncbi:MAG TPA: hypothetical protein VGA37_11840 [Gemmatimonadales bacterium]
MTQPRSSLAIALQDYKGIRPGVALTIAAVALIAAILVGLLHVVGLGRAASQVREGQHMVRTLNRYTAALEVWRQMATGEIEFEAQRTLRDSIGEALRGELAALRDGLADSTDKSLVLTVMQDLRRPTGSDLLDLGVAGREAMIVLASRRDSALFEAAEQSQRAQIVGGVLIALTILAAGILIVPISWVYVRYKAGVPPGM